MLCRGEPTTEGNSVTTEVDTTDSDYKDDLMALAFRIADLGDEVHEMRLKIQELLGLLRATVGATPTA